MPSKYDEIIGLYDRTCTRLAESPTEWRNFLKTAGRNFRLRFDEQILLFAQRFDAIAVLEAEKWSGRFGRPVKDGATGIAVFTDPSASDERIKYYFDISDTQQSRTARPVPIWEFHREHIDAIQKALVDSFGATQRLLPQTLISAVENVTNDLLSDGGTPWGVDDTYNEAVRSFVAQSAAYMCLSRLGIEPEAQGVSITDVSLLSTQEGLYTVGEALHSVAAQVLSETARAIRAFNKQNRTIDSANHKGHNIAERNSERSVLENGGNESEKTGETQPRQVVDAETAVSERVAQTPVHRTADDGRTGTALGRRAEGSVGSLGESVRPNVPEGGDHRGTESARPNGMGAEVQQPLQSAGRDRQRSDNLRVSWYADWDEEKAEKSRSAIDGQISITENLAEEQSPAFVFEGKEQADAGAEINPDHTATKINFDPQNETVWWMYLNTDADSGAQYVDYEISFDAFKELAEQHDIANHPENAERFISDLEEMADQTLSDIRTPFFLEAQADYEGDADFIEFTPENILQIHERILSYEVDREAERDIDRGETVFGADGTKVFRDTDVAEPTEEPTVRFDPIEFAKLIPHEMRIKEAHLVNGNEAFWVTQEPFTVEQLREFQQAVRTYNSDVKKFYVTPRDLSDYNFEEDLARNVFAVVTPDAILKDDYVRAMQEAGLWDYLTQEAPAEQPVYDIGMGYLGNGLTVWNRAMEINGDYQTIAHISPEGEISYRVSGLPTEVVETIERAAKTERQQARFIASYRRYAEIKHDNPDGIVLFQIGDFFEMYGADAQTASEALNLMLSSRAVNPNERIPMCGIPRYELQHTINQLNQNNHDVVVAENKNGSYSVESFPASAAEQAKFSTEEFEKHIPHEMRYKIVDPQNDDTVYWVTQGVFGQHELEKFQKAVKDYGFEFKNFYVTVRTLSPHYDFDEDATAGVLARVTPDLIDAEMYFNALRSEGIEIETRPNSLTFSIGFSEHPAFYDKGHHARFKGMSFALGNRLLGVLDEKQHREREIKDNIGWYHKTDFAITAVIGGKDFHYEGRFDIGDGEGDLIAHIKNYYNYCLSPNCPYIPEWKRQGEDFYQEHLEELRFGRDEFVPFLEQHIELTAEDEKRLTEIMATESDWYGVEESPKEETVQQPDSEIVARYVDTHDDGYTEHIAITHNPDGYTVQYNFNEATGDATAQTGPHKALEDAKQDLIAHRPTSQEAAVNFQITDANLGEGGKKVKYRRNLNAINLLHNLERDGRQASPEAQEILSQYVGWGGIPEAFDQNNAAWATEFAELRAALTPEEYESARSSTLNAHYTSPTVIKAIYEAIGSMGFQAKKILEPAMGVGNFFGMLPAEMRQSELYGVELDSVSGRIAKQLYPTANITIAGYETTHYKDFFDLAVGNVPFGPYSVNDAEYNRLKFPIHDYFFAKMLDQVKPGGVIACVTSRYTMDKKSCFARQYIAARAELLGAIRLPNNAFKANAGTETVTDILFLQKREHLIASKDDWIYLDTMDGFTVNEYFVEHPEMVLGSLAMGTAQYGREELTVEPIQGASLSELLHQAIQNIHLAAAIPESIEEVQEAQDETSSHAIPADPTVRNFSFTERDGTIYYREDDEMSPQEFSVTQAQRIRGMIEIRDCVRELIEQEKEDFPDEQILETQARLNEMYDAYTKKYGLLNATTNKNLFHTDVSYPLLSSLETLDADGKLIGKSDVFTKRTIRPHIPVTHTNTGIEALAVSIGEKGRVDMEYMRQLTGKDESDIFEELKGEIFLNPKYDADPARQHKYLTADEYLSGNVREKLRDATVAANLYGEYAANVDALEKVIPKDLTTTEIEVRLGAAWLPVDVIQQFATELMENKWKDYHTIEFCKQTAKWSVAHKTHGWSDKECITYGTKRANFYEILEDTLNLREVCVYDYVTNEEGKKKAVLNRDETEIARDKQETIKQAFRDWIWKDSTRRERLTRMYNEMFNSIRPREYDGSHLVLAGMNPEIQLKPYQRNAVARILYGGNTLLAHTVGAGKTFEMAAAAMELKRLGLCHKPMFIVPNHLTEQWAAEFLRLYPAANILVTTKKDFETANRKRFCSRIATGEWDAVIIGHSQFEKIPMSDEYRERSLLEQRKEVVDTLAQERAFTNRSPFTVKELEGVKKRIDAELKELNSLNRKDSVITFEDLGVDRIFVDESHYFKNLYLYTKMRNVGGVASTSAQKTSDLYMKCRYLDELTGNRGTVFATGTPISNSMVELYTIQRYLQRDELKRNGFASFDSWASTFGETVDATELAPEGTGYRVKTRFARFFNLPELIAMFREVADIQTADMLDLPVPKANYHTINTQPSDIQKKLVESLADRAYDIRKGNVDSRVDNMLKVTSDGRKLALDQRLLNPMLPDYAGSKLNTCVENVYRIWDEGRDQHTTQLVFCDLSTPKNDGEFNVYDDVRNKLVAKGVPKEEIQFIHEAATEAKKTALFKAVQDGRVRILMGSTQKLGAGTNVQNRLVALHDLDVPWRPSDLEQRSGRIVRQGNENAEVDIYRYVTQGTFDAYLYQLVESKQRFVSQIMTSRSPVRSAEDVDEAVLSYAEIKMLATGDPRIKEKMDLDIQVQKLRLLKSNFLSEQYEIEDRIQREYPQRIASLQLSIEQLTEDTETVKANGKPFDGTFSGMEINGITYSDKKGAGEALLAACAECTTAEKNLIGFYRGFNMALSFNPWEKAYVLTLSGAGTYDVELGSDAYGNLTRIDHAIDRIPTTLGKTKELLKCTKHDLANAKTALQNTFPQEAELADKQARLNELNAALDISSPAPTKKHPAAR